MIAGKPTATRPAREGDHKPADCPPWCVEEHKLPQDEEHGSEINEVELTNHLYTSGDQTWLSVVLASILTDSADGEPYISLVNHNGAASDRLTADEAEQLAEILHQLAATLRGARHDFVTNREDV